MDKATAAQPATTVLPVWYRELYERSSAGRFGLSFEEFGARLNEVGKKYLPAGASEAERQQFFNGLRLEELALTHACALGRIGPWIEFMNRYREPLYSAAYTIAHDEATGRELADSIYADLYGIKPGSEDGQARQSKLSSYSGRGSLEGWLRTVLAQEYVNRYRKTRRLVSLEEQAEAGVQFAAPDPAGAAVTNPRVTQATDEALAALDAESRYLLAAYFLDGWRLAEIGRTLGAHESTISRKLERICRDLRKAILRSLKQKGMSAASAEEALDLDVRDLAVNVRERLRPPPEGGRQQDVGER